MDRQLFREFQEETGIEVKVLLAPDNGYETLLGTCLSGGNESIDIFMAVAGSWAVSAELPDVEVYVVAHHGSRYASGAYFLSRILPELAVISVGRDNGYGHPASETLERLSDIGSQVLRTDELGTIVIER